MEDGYEFVDPEKLFACLIEMGNQFEKDGVEGGKKTYVPLTVMEGIARGNCLKKFPLNSMEFNSINEEVREILNVYFKEGKADKINVLTYLSTDEFNHMSKQAKLERKSELAYRAKL